VVTALTDGLQEVIDTSPRIKITDTYLGETYYVPDVLNMSASGSIYQSVLLRLNQDPGAPLCKVINVSVDSDRTRVVDVYATVEYLGLFGREKTDVFSASLSIPHYEGP
jgi:hypothetical protein